MSEPNQAAAGHAPAPAQTYSTDDEFPGYRPVSAAALTGFLLSLASVMVFVSLNYVFLPVLGLVVCSIALRRISVMQDRLVGRRLALVGLTLSLTFGLVAPAIAVVQHFQVNADARRFAEEWFNAAAEGDSEFVSTLHMPLSLRRGSEFDKVVKTQTQARQMVSGFLREPAVQVLLALGPRAQARFYWRESFDESATGEIHAVDIYAVTVDEAGERTTFFVDVTMDRSKNAVDQSWGWTLRSATIRNTPPPGIEP
jgi:hypothetical protein